MDYGRTIGQCWTPRTGWGILVPRMKARTPALCLLVPLAILAASSLRAEIVLLKNGKKLEGQIVITYDRGVLLREKETSPGRYYPYDEVSRIATEDGMLYYLMPRGTAPRAKGRSGFFPLARVLLPGGRKASPIPCLEVPKKNPIRVTCTGARDAVTLDLNGGGTVHLLGLAPPPESAGKALTRKAARYLSERVKGRDVFLFPGPQSPENRGQPQAYVVSDGKLLNGEMIERGWARTAPLPAVHRYREAFDSLQRYAKNLGLGIWAAKKP